jgi:ubiquinone/menaquinone biosynthesis C-methylase UbiE
VAVPDRSRTSAQRAESLYDRDYAQRYRHRDEELTAAESYQALVSWLGSVCRRFDHPLDVLDLGCGTGRYFWGVTNVATLTGIDASDAMLAEARHPVYADRIQAASIALVKGDLASHEFADSQFDLVYSIGVLAEHARLDSALVARVWRWLKPGGRFAFTTVHPQSADVPRTPSRRLAELLLPLVPGAAGTRLHARLMAGGMYGDERWIRDRMAAGFEIESLERYLSDVHLHGRCVARKVAR